jgi:aconitate hydratase
MQDSFKAKATLRVGQTDVDIFRLDALERAGIAGVSTLPYSIRVLLENLLRNEDGKTVTKADIEAVAKWDPKAQPALEIAYRPARVLLQDFTGVPCVADLAAMRDAVARMGGDPPASTRFSPWTWSSTTRCRSTPTGPCVPLART